MKSTLVITLFYPSRKKLKLKQTPWGRHLKIRDIQPVQMTPSILEAGTIQAEGGQVAQINPLEN